MNDNGQRTLWVAIADAHYVQAGTALDRSAAARATSVYLPHTVLPMLPPKLADDLCSLRAGVDRLAMVVGMDLDDGNNVANTHAYEAVIHVKDKSPTATCSRPTRDDMLALAASWQDRGFASTSTTPNAHASTAKTSCVWRSRPNKATRMIESFMVATNAAVGHLLGAAGAPLPWRCHAPPDRPEVEGLNAVGSLGHRDQLPMPSQRKHGQSETDELANLLGDWADLGVVASTSAWTSRNRPGTRPNRCRTTCQASSTRGRNGILASWRRPRPLPARSRKPPGASSTRACSS